VATYRKLVRDRIPEIIERDGATPVVRPLDDAEFVLALQAKLIEEWGEFLAAPSAEELADVVEVIRALAEGFGYGWDEVEAARHRKRTARGGFDARLFLESVDESEER
jgi:predicted house-cleaning noncanonical NTP pyrophosphatase (MazG superfamily)